MDEAHMYTFLSCDCASIFLEYAYDEPIKYKQWISWVTRTNLAKGLEKFQNSEAQEQYTLEYTDSIAPVRREFVPVKPQTPKKMFYLFILLFFLL